MVEFFLGLFVGISICFSLCFGYGIYVLKRKEETAINVLDILLKEKDYIDTTNLKRYES